MKDEKGTVRRDTGGRKISGNENGRRIEEKKRKELENEWKVIFWNVARLRNKDRDFWKELEYWDVIVLSETWVDEIGWERIRGNLSKGYK